MWQSSAPGASTEPRRTPFLQWLLQKCCMHRFSWPHTGRHGQDYQVCLICGAAYEFDTTTMRRTGRLVDIRQQP